MLYADGLSILESAFLTTDKQDYTPDIMREAMAVNSILTIPGNGTEHPVNPGEYIIIADNGINHQAQNSNSIDLSKADFEIFYEDSDDIDNHEVPNILTPYGKFVFHNRGFNSYAIARLGDIEKFLQDYTYDYEWMFVFEEYQIPREEKLLQSTERNDCRRCQFKCQIRIPMDCNLAHDRYGLDLLRGY